MQLQFKNTPANCTAFLRACSLHALCPLKIKMHERSENVVASFSKNEERRVKNIEHWINHERGEGTAEVIKGKQLYA